MADTPQGGLPGWAEGLGQEINESGGLDNYLLAQQEQYERLARRQDRTGVESQQEWDTDDRDFVQSAGRRDSGDWLSYASVPSARASRVSNPWGLPGDHSAERIMAFQGALDKLTANASTSGAPPHDHSARQEPFWDVPLRPQYRLAEETNARTSVPESTDSSARKRFGAVLDKAKALAVPVLRYIANNPRGAMMVGAGVGLAIGAPAGLVGAFAGAGLGATVGRLTAEGARLALKALDRQPDAPSRASAVASTVPGSRRTGERKGSVPAESRSRPCADARRRPPPPHRATPERRWRP